MGVLQHAHDYNCTFEEAISKMLENKQKKEFVFRNRKWLSLDTCCDFYKINKYSVQQLQYQCGYTVQEALERSINHTNLFSRICNTIIFITKLFPIFRFSFRFMHLNMILSLIPNWHKTGKVRQKCIAEDISLAEALNYYLIQHPVRRKNDYDSTICHKSIAEQCRQYGIKYYDVYNYSSRYNCSKEEAIKHCLEVKQKLGTDVIEFDGVKYADLQWTYGKWCYHNHFFFLQDAVWGNS